jgi:hypothetical protein
MVCTIVRADIYLGIVRGSSVPPGSGSADGGITGVAACSGKAEKVIITIIRKLRITAKVFFISTPFKLLKVVLGPLILFRGLILLYG